MGATALPREVTCVGLWMDEKTPPGMAVIHTLSLPSSGRRAGNGFLSARL